MSFEQKIKNLTQKNSELTKLKKEIRELSSDIFEDFYKHLFEKYPTLDSFGWTQYTPYFNDGESCIFFANTDYLIINGQYAEDSNWFCENNVIDWGVWNPNTRTYEGRVEETNSKYDKVLVEANLEISNFLNTFDNDFYLEKFGDHAEITVTRHGVEISDYDHD